LEELVKKGKVAGYKIRHAQMLLKADQGKQGPGWQDKQIAEAFGAHLTTVERLRKRLVEQGLKAALERNKRQNYTRKVAGYKIRHAQMLLKADQGKRGPGRQDAPPSVPDTCRPAAGHDADSNDAGPDGASSCLDSSPGHAARTGPDKGLLGITTLKATGATTLRAGRSHIAARQGRSERSLSLW
jgi:hypothetical protein